MDRMDRMELILIRHPRVDVAPGICYGASDVGLAEDAAAVASRLKPLLPEACTVFSSPLQRCRKLAEFLSPSVTFVPGLVEMNFGEWEMKSFDDIDPLLIDTWALDPYGFRPPGGESAAAMATRVQAAFAGIRALANDDPLVIVAHGGPLRAIAGPLLGLPMDNWLSLDFACGKASLFDLQPARNQLKGFNLAL